MPKICGRRVKPSSADLTLAVVAINGWNRLNIAFRTVPGTYQPGMLAAQLAA